MARPLKILPPEAFKELIEKKKTGALGDVMVERNDALQKAALVEKELQKLRRKGKMNAQEMVAGLQQKLIKLNCDPVAELVKMLDQNEVDAQKRMICCELLGYLQPKQAAVQTVSNNDFHFEVSINLDFLKPKAAKVIDVEEAKPNGQD